MQTWEYHVTQVTYNDRTARLEIWTGERSEVMEQGLTYLGSLGWELVGIQDLGKFVDHARPNYLYIFKKPTVTVRKPSK